MDEVVGDVAEVGLRVGEIIYFDLFFEQEHVVVEGAADFGAEGLAGQLLVVHSADHGEYSAAEPGGALAGVAENLVSVLALLDRL